LLNYTLSGHFQSSVAISTPCPSQFTQNPIPNADLAYSAGKLFVTWAQQTPCATGPYNIYFDSLLASNPVPPQFPQKSIISDSQFTGYPRLSQYGGDPEILFDRSSISDFLLTEYAISSNIQTSFQVNIQSANMVQPPLDSSLVTDGAGNHYVAWEAQERTNGGVDIFFNTMKAGGAFTFNPINLSNNGKAKGPAVAIDSNQYVYVAFFSKSNAFPTTYDLFLEQSKDGGKSFSSAFNVSNSSGDSASYAPGIAISGKTAYLVWDDNTNLTTHCIYFQKVALN
jgi:hypothetical protein